METTLTEFSYGYCVTEEFTRSEPRISAPYFPSLRTEGRPRGGYDVRIGRALFLQFKLSEKMTRGTAREARANGIMPPYFRFKLHARNRSAQHRMLVELAKAGLDNCVFYAAPAFDELVALDEAYRGKRVGKESRFFSPREIGLLPDDGPHVVAFRADEVDGWFMSQARRIRVYQMKNIIEQMLSQAANTRIGVWLNQTSTLLRKIIRKYYAEPTLRLEGPKRMAELELLYEIVNLARVYFGCETLFVAER